jgi:UDP-GlcNAc:undecaprenyl-phosphate/decaprenyl-phosphate GlcNAc-1-phosphate transferase
VYSILFLAISSFVLSLLLTPLVRRGFSRLGILDQPNPERKLHCSPIPRIGGIPIAASYLMAFALLLLSPLRGASSVSLPLVLSVMPAVMVVFTTGLLDDLVGLPPWQKLLGQVSGSALAYYCGIRLIGIAGHSMGGWWSLPLTILWLVACSNAFNLIDGVDGLATGVGLFATMTICISALLQQNIPLAMATLPMAGALLGFLRYNFNPASIFLGDCGSLSIGFLLGCCGVIWSQKSATVLAMTAPLMALSIPLVDTALAICRRFLRHQPIFGADRNHIHHRLLDRGFSPRKVTLLLYGLCGVAATFSLLQSLLHNRFGGLIIVLFCVATWAGVRYLGYSEFGTARLLALQGTFRHILHAQLYLTAFEKKLRLAKTPEECWWVIREAGKEYGFVGMRMFLQHTLYETQLKDTSAGKSWTIRISLSDSEYVNLTHERESSVQTMLAITSLAEILQRALGGRAAQSHTSVEFPLNGSDFKPHPEAAISLARQN